MTHRLRSALTTAFFTAVLFATPLLASEGEAATDSWAPTFARMFNFALLAGLVYLVAKKFGAGEYFSTRSATIRKDLVDAKTLRTEAEAQLAGVRAKLAALPGELRDLKQRGDDELAAEKVRLANATAAERTRMQEQTRREIELTSRLARRELVLHGANLSMNLARKRIERDITAEDQARLIDAYKPEVRQ